MSPFYTDEIIKNTSLSQMIDDLSLLLFNKFKLHLLGSAGYYQFFVFMFMVEILLTAVQSSQLSSSASFNLCQTDYLSLKLLEKLSQGWKKYKINARNVSNLNYYVNFITKK